MDDSLASDGRRGTSTRARRRRPARAPCRGRETHLADGIVITPSHNPPDNGGLKYNPPNGGPADTDATAGDDIVVTGVRASIVGALNVRKQSTQIVDSIVAEDVGKLPDNNVVEALHYE